MWGTGACAPSRQGGSYSQGARGAVKQGSLAALRQAVHQARTLDVHGFMGPHSSESTQRREDPTEPSGDFV
jgi:hypothetical protein